MPLNVSGEMFNDTAVTLKWQYPARPNGLVQGFIIYYIYELTDSNYSNEVSITREMQNIAGRLFNIIYYIR